MNPLDAVWKKIGLRHHHGIDLPLFCLYSQKSAGIGEYLDLIPLVDWCAEVGFDTIMLLPLNDSNNDPSPYNALTANALHPIYISISQLPLIDGHQDLIEIIDYLRGLNKTARVDYHEVLKKKKLFLRLYYNKVWSHFQEEVARFSQDNPHLKVYALFKTFKLNMEFHNWMDWPEEIRTFSNTKLKEHLQKHEEEVNFHLFVQYLCYMQLKSVKEYAESKGLFLKGDIPILICPDSADVWAHPEYFDLTFAAGAPPDIYSPSGQYWGFPIYKWSELARDNYGWWRERLNYANHFYHMYRIDHVVGFFRIFAIERGMSPLTGHFIPDDLQTSIAQGNAILSTLVQNSPMLPIAEDLGCIPIKVTEHLAALGIPGMKVIRWERNFETNVYYPFDSYNPLSMTSVSTHDSSTLTQWWAESPEEAKPLAEMKGWDYSPKLSFEQRFELLRDSHHSSSLFHINLINEYLALFPELVHENPDDERINIPGETLETNWTYRLKPSLEELISHEPLKEAIKKILKS